MIIDLIVRKTAERRFYVLFNQYYRQFIGLKAINYLYIAFSFVTKKGKMLLLLKHMECNIIFLAREGHGQKSYLGN